MGKDQINIKREKNILIRNSEKKLAVNAGMLKESLHTIPSR